MSKRIKKPIVLSPATAPAAKAPAAPPPPPSGAAEVLRRMLLAVLTLVVVARPFVWGEDAGLVSELADPSGMVLSFLTLAACAGWAVWLLLARRGPRLGAAEVALVVLALLMLLGSAVAPYFRAAWFTGAEWLALAMLLVLTRQLAFEPEEQHGLMTVLLATMVALCAHGVFQAVYQTPRLAKQADTPQKVVTYLGNLRGVAPTPAENRQLLDQIEKRLVTGPFTRSVSLAACLVLLLPLACGAVVACARSKAPPLLTGPVALCAILAAVVLGLTRWSPAVAALCVAGLLWLGVCWPKKLGGPLVGVLAGAAAGAGVVYFMHGRGLFDAELAVWREVWPASYRVGESRFWTGVGGGHFRFYYPRHMTPEAGYRVGDPSNSYLELFCESGVLGVVALLVALALAARQAVRWWLAPPAEAAPTPPTPAPAPTPQGDSALDGVRWEFYLGGMLATILAFTLRAQSLSPAELTGEAFAAGIRSVAWFLAFALFERVSWTPREYVGSLAVGLVGMLLVFGVGPGLGNPGVASLLWVGLGLLLAVVSPAREWAARLFPRVALPALIVVALVYLAFVVFPASIGTYSVREAKRQAAVYYSDRLADEGERRIGNPDAFVEKEILNRLEAAQQDDPGNVRIFSMLGDWQIRRWRIVQGGADPEKNKEAKAAVYFARKARGLNVEGPDGYVTEHGVYFKMGGSFVSMAKQVEDDLDKDKKEKKMPADVKQRAQEWSTLCNQKASEAYGYAAQAASDYLTRDPTSPSLRYLVAEALDLAATHQEKVADNPYKKEQVRLARLGAKEAAQATLDLDRAVGEDRPRSLSDQQRDQMRAILKK